MIRSQPIQSMMSRRSSRLLRLLDRLGRVPDVLAHIFGRRALQVRHLVAHARPVLVEPPGERRHPGEAALDQHDLAAWGSARTRPPAPGWPVSVCMLLRQRVVLLEVEGRPAAAGRGVPAAHAADVQRRSAGRLRRRRRRSASSAGGPAARSRAAAASTWTKSAVGGAPLDLRDRRCGVLRTARRSSRCSRGSCSIQAATCQSLMARAQRCGDTRGCAAALPPSAAAAACRIRRRAGRAAARA